MKKLCIGASIFLTVALLAGNIPDLVVFAERKEDVVVSEDIQNVAEPVMAEESAVAEEPAVAEGPGTQPSYVEEEPAEEPRLSITNYCFVPPEDNIAFKEGESVFFAVYAENIYDGITKKISVKTDDTRAVVWADITVGTHRPAYILEMYVNDHDARTGRLARRVDIICTYEDKNGETFVKSVACSVVNDYPVVKKIP